MNQMAEDGNTESKVSSRSRIVMHIDFDYFYAQCEEIRRPEIKNNPLVVCIYSGRTEDSGVVSTSNYVARRHGVKSAMPIKFAKSKLDNIPGALFLPADMKYYSVESASAISIIRKFVNDIEYVGLDECFIDATELIRISIIQKPKN